MFWNLPFSNIKQSHAVRNQAGVTWEEWAAKWEEIVAEHDLPGAREQLSRGRKEYLESHGAGKAQPAGSLLAYQSLLASLLWSWMTSLA